MRGGAEKGQQWFEEGKRFKKRNSMTDFVACADALAAGGYAHPDKIVSYGLSAGGLLVGGAMNIAPERWAGIIAKVPFVDMLNTMSDADHPLVPLFRPDWGDPERGTPTPEIEDLLYKYKGNYYSVSLDGDFQTWVYNRWAYENPEFHKAFSDQHGYQLGPPRTW